MLRITLYKHCILNETYANVFSMGKINNKTILEKYLDTLDSKTFEIDKVYQENSGQFVFDYDITPLTDIYDYNYMKVETVIENEDVETVKILRYCFIQEIILKNELVYLNYEEDMWHSYIEKIIGINESYLNKSRLKNYGNNFKLNTFDLPFNYNGNKLLEVEELVGSNNANSLYDIIVEIQYYNEAVEGKKTNLYTKILSISTENSTFNWCENKINQLISNKSVGKYGNRAGGLIPIFEPTYYYDIGDIYIVPREFGISINFLSYPEAKIFDENNDEIADLWLIATGELYSGEILNNFKNISFGTFNSQFPITSNGNKVEFKLECYKSYSNILLYLSTSNSKLDITNDFRYEIPISSISSSERQQKEIALSLKNTNIEKDKEIIGIETRQKTINSGTKAISSIGGDILKGAFVGGGLGIAGSVMSGVGTGISAVNDIVANQQIANAKQEKLTAEKNAINSPVYTSVSGVFGNSSTFFNSKTGIVLFKTNSENDDFVKKAINNLGHNAYEFISNINLLRINDAEYFRTNNINYNIIGFTIVSCYGSFARNTAKVLNGILESGVKIWYNENLQEDNYQVG